MTVLALEFTSDTVETLKNVATGTSVGAVIIALIALKFIKSMVLRAITSIILIALGLAVYSQRSQLSDCVDKASARLEAAQGPTGSASPSQPLTCSFFGRDFTVKIPTAG